MGNAFHQAAVTGKHVGVVIDNVVTIAIELGRQALLSQRHADTIGQTLTERASGGFNTGGVAQLRVARGFGVQLTEVFQFVDRQVIAGQVQQRVNQHGAMTVGHDEAVAIGPFRVLRVVLHEVIPQDFGDVRHTHGGAGVAAGGFLDGVHTQGANRIG